MTLDPAHTPAHTAVVMFGDADRGGVSGAHEPTGASLQAREPARRPETAAERRARRTAYLGDWPRLMREHAQSIRNREGR